MSPHQNSSDDALVGGRIFPTHLFGQKHSFSSKTWHQMLTLAVLTLTIILMIRQVSILIKLGSPV